jgi:Zn-finger nucleic acid-binding protein
MAERQGVEIDYCPTCRGIWLDRGELDKILDRAAGGSGAGGVAGAGGAPVADPGPPPGFDDPRGYPPPGYGDRFPDDRYRDERYREDRYRDDRRDPRDPRSASGRKKRRESWLGDLLDFD